MKESRNQTSIFPAADENIAPEAAQNAAPVGAPYVQNVPHAKPKRVRAQIKPHTNELDGIYKLLVAGLRGFFKKNNFEKAVIGLSGGVDSALTLKIAVDALGQENITALIMPEAGLTKPENTEHAKLLCEFFGITYFIQPINNFTLNLLAAPWKPDILAQMNTKARVRAVLLYSYANTYKALVLGTSNKSETMLGYGTKYGDLAADVEVIADLFKTEVIALADSIGLPPEIVNKTPSAELAPGQTDEGEIGATYRDMDKVLAAIELGEDGCIASALPAPLVHLVFRRIRENKHKTLLPPVIKAR